MKKWMNLCLILLVVVLSVCSEEIMTPVSFMSSTSPLSADLDGDGEKEFVFAGDNGTLHLFESDGQEIVNGKWPRHISGPVQEKIEVFEKKDGNTGIVVSTYDGDVYYIGLDGDISWMFETGKLNEVVHMLGAPGVDSVNNRIMVANTIGEVFVLNSDGEIVVQSRTGYSISATPVMTDMNGDGHKDYVYKSDDGDVYIYDGFETSEQGSFVTLKGFPVRIKENYNPLPYPVTVSDTDFDGKKEIILATNRYKDSFYIYGIDNNGMIKFKIKNGRKVFNEIKCYDVDRDGIKDLVFTDIDGMLNVLDVHGKNISGFPVKAGERIKGNPEIIDVDGDGICEIVLLSTDQDFSVAGESYEMKVYNNNGELIKNIDIGEISGGVVFHDIEGDGDLEITFSGNGFVRIKDLGIFDPIDIELIGVEYEY